MDKDEKVSIPSLEDNHYYIFSEDFNPTSSSNFIKFIIERNLITKNRPQCMKLIINSHGGELPSAFAVIDTLKGSAIPVHTYGLGAIASCGLMTFIAGKKGKRFITRNTSILSHQFSGATFGKEHELFATFKEYDLTKERVFEHYKKCTGLNEKEIKKYLLPPEDVWLSAKEAIKLGIADEIVEFY